MSGTKTKKRFSHEMLERNVGLLIIFSILVVSFSGLVQIVPLFFQHSTTTAAEGVRPYEALSLVGRDVYIREGCVGCHSQQIRKLQSEVQRYGPYSIAAESVYDHPFLWGSKRTGPDLARVGQRYSDEWHRIHLRNPRDVVKESNMPAYAWLQHNTVEGADVQERMKVLRVLGVPYTDEEIAAAPDALKGKTEEDAIVAYLQGLGVGGRAAAEQAMQVGGNEMLAVINGIVTVLAMLTFAGIVWWAWSAHRVEANRQAAQLPFALPEEYQNDRKAGDTHE